MVSFVFYDISERVASDDAVSCYGDIMRQGSQTRRSHAVLEYICGTLVELAKNDK